MTTDREALDAIQLLIEDVENKYGDPHTLRHAKAALAALTAQGGEQMLVPVAFLRGFNTLTHNYSLGAEPPFYYSGRAGDAFKDAYARCAKDLAQLKAILSAQCGEQTADTLPQQKRDVLMDKSLEDYIYDNLREACSAWSDVRSMTGQIDQAKCQYAAAIEERVRKAVCQLINEFPTADTVNPPEEPTNKMVIAGIEAGTGDSPAEMVRAIYKAMYAAAKEGK